jgi:hypothetical protein
VGDRLTTRPRLIERTPGSNPGPNLDLRLRPSMSLARPWRLMGHSKGSRRASPDGSHKSASDGMHHEVQTTGASILDGASPLLTMPWPLSRSPSCLPLLTKCQVAEKSKWELTGFESRGIMPSSPWGQIG